jgi:hypothetical protein
VLPVRPVLSVLSVLSVPSVLPVLRSSSNRVRQGDLLRVSSRAFGKV